MDLNFLFVINVVLSIRDKKISYRCCGYGSTKLHGNVYIDIETKIELHEKNIYFVMFFDDTYV